ncbi:hypothetical protein ACFRFQ_12055 [Rhodococcus sp. NPDC056743]|uniref:hypothetical protein n=1 Tax=Rhodococcus sp. NPDC056743 TaxID=3345934 RepID=UPI00366F83FE
MNEEEPNTGQRVRRRASRNAGPTGADTGAASTVVPSSAQERVDLVKSEQSVTAAHTATETSPKIPEVLEVPKTSANSESSAPTAKRPTSRKLIGGIVLASIVALAFAVVSVLLLVDRSKASSADEERAAYIAGARTTALNLTTLHSETAGADLDKFLAGTTKEFQSQLDGRKDSFVDVLGQVGVQTDGEILEAGLEKIDGDCGTSLVAVRALQKNAEQPEPEERNYRLRITMCDTDGQLLASNVEFVP